jgi:cellulose synthase/poly-beta-1,6-N-acetylglucosamine synthase-like glycosyltransferase
MPDNNQPFLSIIIPALNEEKYVNACLTSIKDLEYSKDLYEIIMVDNGSEDRTVEIAKRCGAQILSKLEGSIGSLRNFGVKHARGDILGFVDADCQVPRKWLKTGLNHFKNNEVAAVGCRLRHDESTWVAKGWSLIHSEKIEEGEVDWIPSGSMLVSKTCFEKVNGFSEELMTSEDVDLCIKLRSIGYKIISEPKISAIHLDPPKTLLKFFNKELWHGQEMLRTNINQNLKLSRALAYGIFYSICMICVAFGILLSLIFKSNVVLFFSLFLFFLAPFILAIKTALINKSYKSIIGLILIYMAYGLARSVCLLGYRK